MALAGQHDYIAGLRRLERQGDGRPAVGLLHQDLGPAHAGPDLRGDGSGVLATRVVGGEDGEVGQAGGDLAHQRSLGPVAVAAAAEDHQHTPGPGHAAGTGEGLLKGVGGVGVVDQHREGLAPVDRLVAAGHRCQVRQPGRHRAGRHPELAGCGRRRQGVGDIDRAGQAQANRLALPREAGAQAVIGEVVGVGHGERSRRQAGCVEEAPAPGVIRVDDPERSPLRHEQRRLGREVLLDRSMEIEVVLAEVGEDDDGEVHAVHPVLDHGVGADLHGHRVEPLPGQLGQVGLKFGGRRRGSHAGKGPDHRGQPAGGLEDRAEEVGGGRLAVGSGHADDRHAPGRVAIQSGGHLGHAGADLVDLHLGHCNVDEALDQEGDGAGPDRGGGEVVTVGTGAGHTAEQRPGDDGSGVVADGHDLGAVQVTPNGACLYLPEQPTESHAVPMVSSSVRSRA